MIGSLFDTGHERTEVFQRRIIYRRLELDALDRAVLEILDSLHGRTNALVREAAAVRAFRIDGAR